MSRTCSIGFPAFALVVASALGLASESARAGQRVSPSPVSFSKEIAPIIFDRCGECHRAGGSAPFSLLTYSAVKQRATQIAAVTKSRFMPPWKAEPGYGEFIGQRPLTAAEIDLIQSWVGQGALEGNRRDLPPTPRWPEGWRLGKPDLIVTLPQPYTLQARSTDVFRIFVIPLPAGSTRFVRGVEFQPGSPVVHHANILIDHTATSRQLDEQDPEPGYEGLVSLSAVFPDGHFLGWTPGQAAPLLPKGLAWRLEAGTDLVVLLHMQPSGKREVIQPSIGLFFGSDPPERIPAMLRLGSQSIDIPAGEKEYAITDSYVLPVDVEVQAVQPHAHYRAREIRGLATLPDGSMKSLIYVKDWDFRWQHVYRYVTPFVLPKGTTLAMRYTYDNSAENPRNPQQPPKQVLWGQRTSDEMGDLWIQVLTGNDRDLAALNREFRRKQIAEDVIGYETLIRADPRRVGLHDDIAQLYLELDRPNDAVAHFEASVKLKPESAAAHFNLGTALTVAGRLDEAIGHYQLALQIRPGYALAHNNLGDALVLQGKVDEASGHYREALRSDRNNASAHNNLGNLLLQRGDPNEALAHLREALRIDPRLGVAHYNIARAMRLRGELPDAIRHFQEAIRLRPDWAPALTDLAWLLATSPEDGIRDADEAIRLAERAADLTSRRDAGVLDAAAAAYAAAGLFDRAVDLAEAALRLAPTDPAVAGIRERRDLYKQRRPYRSPS